MVAQAVILGAFAALMVVLASILGAVHRRERVAFVLGVAAFVAVHALPGVPETAGMALAVAGLVVAIAATVPMLRQPA